MICFNDDKIVDVENFCLSNLLYIYFIITGFFLLFAVSERFVCNMSRCCAKRKDKTEILLSSTSFTIPFSTGGRENGNNIDLNER